MSGSILPPGAPALLNTALGASGSLPLLQTADALGLNSETVLGQWGIYPAPTASTISGSSLAGAVTALSTGNLAGVAGSLLGTQTPVVAFDSVLNFSYSVDPQVPTYPIEQGGFASYNKVQEPFNIRITGALSGTFSVSSIVSSLEAGSLGGLTGITARTKMLAQLDAARLSLALVNVVTPEKTYQNCNVVHVDFDRTAASGAAMLVVDVWLAEIRVTATSTVSNVASASAADPVNTGPSNPAPVTPVQQTALAAAGAN